MTKEEKIQAVKETQDKINKSFGKGSIVRMSERPKQDIDVFSTGSIGLDAALDCGGLPRGRVVEIYSLESCGKTSLAIHTMVEAQKQGELVAMIDMEHAWSMQYAKTLGIDPDMLDIAQPSSGEEALEIADQLISTGAYGVVVIDSVAALVPQAELDGAMGESKIGLQARLMGQCLRKITPKTEKTNTLVIFINQLREKIGAYGNPNVTSGGKSLQFYASVRLEMSRSTTLENSSKDAEGNRSGNLTKVKVVKNKCGRPFRDCEFMIEYGKGISKLEEITRLGKEKGILALRAGIIKYNDIKCTSEEFMNMLEDNPEFKAELVNKINTTEVPLKLPKVD